MKLYLIDPSGKVWSYPAPGLDRALGRRNSDIDLWSYAVERLGAVEIAIHEHIVTLSWQAEAVTKKAIRSTERLVEASAPREIRFRCEISTWAEVYPSLGMILAERLRLGCAPASVDLPRPSFFSQAHTLEKLVTRPLNRIESGADRQGVLLNWWRTKSGLTSQPEVLEFLYRFEAIDRAALIDTDIGGNLRFAFNGAALNIYSRYDRSWTADGRPFLDQPDPIYAAWCARGYRKALTNGAPIYEYVDAIFRLPGVPSQRSRYDRLLLPWKLADGTTFVSVVAFLSFPRETVHRPAATLAAANFHRADQHRHN
jgi:hypothetical protein